jgi:hypothetical protein
VGQEAAMQRVGIDLEHFVERRQRLAAGLDPVVVEEHGFRDGVGAAVEAPEPVRGPECVPALGLGVALWRVGGAQSIDKHEISTSRSRVATPWLASYPNGKHRGAANDSCAGRFRVGAGPGNVVPATPGSSGITSNKQRE